MARDPDGILDELLVLSAQRGRADALRELIQRWQPRLWLHARRMTGDADIASDVTQDALLAIARTIRRLDDPARFAAWAYRITSNRAVDVIRRRVRDRAAIRNAPAKQQTVTDAQAGDADELRTAIDVLPPDTRAMLSMLYVNRLSIADIAAAFDLPPGTVKSRLHAARQTLKQTLERKPLCPTT